MVVVVVGGACNLQGNVVALLALEPININTDHERQQNSYVRKERSLKEGTLSASQFTAKGAPPVGAFTQSVPEKADVPLDSISGWSRR